ncbi:MAG: response regulator [Alphaproteobacteria bacterium]|jgi:two-component system cell cycle response regulator DivK|nr:response regulator [Thalassospira sp.]MCE2964926.1 response regulator [Alphaproteobacteria bacterium]
MTQSATKTIMIVEDNDLNMKLFHDLLVSQGYKVVGTVDGLAAVELARKHKPDLVLMDIQLPNISGLDITRNMKREDDLRHIPIIAVTALVMRGDEQRFLDGGCAAYIPKPISVPHFLTTVRQYIET